MTRVANRVLMLVAVRDSQQVVHKRGSLVELEPGRVVFYRDITDEVLIRTVNGYALERGVLAWMAKQQVFKVHYRIRGGPLLSTTVDEFVAHGIPWNKNSRDQLVLPEPRWIHYSADLAYDVPPAAMGWTVLDHDTGALVGGLDAPWLAELNAEVSRLEQGFDAHQTAADLAIERLRAVNGLNAHTQDILSVLEYLMKVDKESRV